MIQMLQWDNYKEINTTEIHVGLRLCKYSLQQNVKQQQNKFPVVHTTLINLCHMHWSYFLLACRDRARRILW